MTLRHLKAFHFSEPKKPLLLPFCSEIATFTARLKWQRLCDVSESNGDEDENSTGHCRGIDRCEHRVQFVLTIHSVRRNWRHGYSCIHRQERVGFDEHGVRTKPDRHRRRRDNHMGQQRFRGAHVSGRRWLVELWKHRSGREFQQNVLERRNVRLSLHDPSQHDWNGHRSMIRR